MKLVWFVFLTMGLLFLTGIAVGITIYRNLTVDHWDQVAPGVLFVARSPLELPSLAALTAGAKTDADALAAVVNYVDIHMDTLADTFAESNPSRLRALVAMYEIHTAALYGSVETLPETFRDFVALPIAHCGTFADAQAALLTALGVEWRRVEISGGTHQFIEINVDGQWEITDATINIWIDHSADALMDGGVRTMRTFYTPALDSAYTNAYQPQALRGVLDLRASLPLLGAGWYPKAHIVVSANPLLRTMN